MVAAGVGVEVANKLVVGMIEEAVGDVVTVEKSDIDGVDEVNDALITLVVLDELDVSTGVAALRTKNVRTVSVKFKGETKEEKNPSVGCSYL